MNTNKFNATTIYQSLLQLRFCNKGRDLKQEQDILDVFKFHGFEELTNLPAKFKTKSEKQLIDSGKGIFSKLSREYKTGLYICHHPYGTNRYPDFFLLVNGHILELEAKSASGDIPIFSQGDKVVDPTRRDVFYLFTHRDQGSSLLLAEDLITPENYLLIMKHKQERLKLQKKHDKEFDRICKGQGEKVYHRTNLTPRGGHDITNHIFRARKHNLNKKAFLLLKSYEFNCTLSKV